MEKNSLSFKHISVDAKNTLELIKERRSGKNMPLKTGIEKLDKVLLNGVDWNKIITIAAMSGSGKSVFCEQLKQGFIKNNPNEQFDILSFEMEMTISDQILRNLSSDLNVSLYDLLSAEKPIEDSVLKKVSERIEHYTRKKTFNVEDVGNTDEIINTTKAFIQKRKCKKLVVTVDHVLLTAGKQGQTEREILAELSRALVRLKKECVSNGIDIIIIMLSQLNRNIESEERKANSDSHFPNRNDLFGSNDMFMASDYLMILHMPAILHLKSYGPYSWPVVQKDTLTNLIYMHIIKQRFGEPKILLFKEDFKNARIHEI